MNRVCVTHPGRQHSHQLAQALYNSGRLEVYWTGVPAATPESKGPVYQWLASRSPQPTLRLPKDRLRHCYVEPITRRIANVLCSSPQSVVWQHQAMEWFDRWCARRIPDDIDAVVCYENAALHTFRAAKKQGATTILDAASFHHRWQDAVYDPVEPGEAHARINAHKDEEIEYADHILTVSSLARESYIRGGVPEDDVTVVPMGADLSNFAPPQPLRSPSSPPTFLFVGHAGRRKGGDVLRTASEVLRKRGVSHRVQFAGDTEGGFFDEAPDSFEHLGYLEREELVDAMQGADVLVLPSRHDSFGRVVVEGMATGLPALVSEHVGAKEVISEGESGWIVPAEDPEALADQMHWCAENSGSVARMQTAAVADAQEYTWKAYRSRVVQCLEEVVDEYGR